MLKKTINKIILAALIGFYVFLLLHFKPWQGASDSKEYLLAITVLLTLGGLICCCITLLFEKTWGRIPFVLFNVIYFLFGCYLTHFRWTFCLFEEPALIDKIYNTWPSFIFGVCLPLSLLYYVKRLSK